MDKFVECGKCNGLGYCRPIHDNYTQFGLPTEYGQALECVRCDGSGKERIIPVREQKVKL